MNGRPIVVSGLLMLGTATAVAQSGDRRPVIRPWVGASAGFATLTVEGNGHSGIAGDIVGGLELGGGLRFGLRGTTLRTISLGDQPPWSSTSTMFVTGYAPPRWPAAFTAGIGRLRWDQEGGFAGRSRVLETGIEFFVPARHGLALRVFGSRLWSVGRATLTSTTSVPPPTINGQTQIGVGFVVH